MKIYKTRYQAEKEKIKGREKIVKVNGGYVIMSYDKYKDWRKQK